MTVLKLKKLYLSALAIVLAVLVLLAVISISTIRNLDRAERNALDALDRQGESLVQALAAGARNISGPLDALLQEAAPSETVSYLYLKEPGGEIICRSGPAPASAPLAADGTGAIRQLPDGARVYELSSPFPGEATLVLGLRMDAFDETRRADLHHAVMMAAIVLALGAGALFFFFVIHNYYSVEKALEKSREKVRRAEKLAAIGTLAAGVAHEIRNPLSSIRGFAQFLGHTLKDRPEEKEYADIMVREIDRINRVVGDLITFARPLEPEPSPVSLPKLVDHLLRLIEADARARNVHITRRLPDPLPPLWLDTGLMTQALLNLLLNSLQAVPENGRIEIAATLPPGSSRLCLSVEDDGVGIAEEHLEKILDPFFTTRDKGTGLGLAIVQKIVENHQGAIRIESPPPGKAGGTRISLLIPGALRKKEMEADET